MIGNKNVSTIDTLNIWFSIKEIKLYGLNLLSCVDTTSNHQSKTSIKNCIFHCGEEESREIIKLRH